MSARPLLALDVDGVLNVACSPSVARGRGLVRDEIKVPTPWSDGRWVRLRLHLDPTHGPALLALAANLGVELAWATTWNHQANEVIAPRVGLPELPVIEVPAPTGDLALTPHHWKRDAILAYAGDRPLAWLDDDLRLVDQGWADRRTSGGAPTLLLPTNADVGLRDEHLADVHSWVERLAEAA